MPLRPADIELYYRQILLPEWGAAGQERVCTASARVVGAGPGAETAARYLAGAGVARLSVMSEALGEELRRLRPDLEVEVEVEEVVVVVTKAEMALAPESAAVARGEASGGGLALELGTLRLTATRDGITDGAALALEALKAVLGLPHRTEVDLPRWLPRLHQDHGADAS